jgi:hypothetical protein
MNKKYNFKIVKKVITKDIQLVAATYMPIVERALNIL